MEFKPNLWEIFKETVISLLFVYVMMVSGYLLALFAMFHGAHIFKNLFSGTVGVIIIALPLQTYLSYRRKIKLEREFQERMQKFNEQMDIFKSSLPVSQVDEPQLQRDNPH